MHSLLIKLHFCPCMFEKLHIGPYLHSRPLKPLFCWKNCILNPVDFKIACRFTIRLRNLSRCMATLKNCILNPAFCKIAFRPPSFSKLHVSSLFSEKSSLSLFLHSARIASLHPASLAHTQAFLAPVYTGGPVLHTP